MRRSKVTIAVLLSIALISSTLFSSAAVFAESKGGDNAPSPEASTKIEDYLYDSQILTGDGGIYDPSTSMNPSGSFFVKLMFSEIAGGDNARQFPDDGMMTYQIPSIIAGFDAIENLPIKETKTEKKIGTYSISKGGEITVDLDDDYVQEYTNIKAFLTFEGSFSKEAISGEEEVVIKFSDSISITVALNDTATLGITKKASSYDYRKNEIKYTVKVSTDYAAENVIVTDTMNDMLAADGALSVKNKVGKDVKFEELPSEGATWKINVGNMEKGEIYTITYTAKLSDKAFRDMAKSSAAKYQVTAANEVTATSDNSEPVETKKTSTIEFSRLEKSVVKQGNHLVWTVKVNTNKYLDLSGYTLTDTMDKGLVIDKNSKMEIKKDGTTITDVPKWSVLSDSDTEWRYVFPSNAGKSAYTFVYKSNIPENTIVSQNGSSMAFKNKISLKNGSEEEYNGQASYHAPGPKFSKEKYATVYPGGTNIATDAAGNCYIRWTNVITVPSTGLSELKFTDDIRKDTKAHTFDEGLFLKRGAPKAADGFNVVNVDGFDGDMALEQHGNKGFSLYFGTKAADQGASSLPPAAEGYKVKITCYTKVTGDENGSRRNWGKIFVGTSHDEDYEDQDVNVNLTGSKNGVLDAEAKSIAWTVKIESNHTKLGDADVIVKDTFSDNQAFDSNYGVYLNNTKLKDSAIEKVSATEYHFNLGKMKNNTSYTLKYKTKVKEGVLIESGKKEFKNKALVTINGKQRIELSKTLGVTIKIVDKKLAQQPTLQNQYKAGFRIILNPNKALLNSESAEKANDYELIDKYSKNMELDFDSFVITRDDKDILGAKDYQIKHEIGEKYNTLTILINKADGHKYTIDYKAAIKGAIGEEVNYTNTAELFINKKIDSGITDEHVVIKQQSSNAGAAGSKMAIHVQKRDSANINKVLEGAEFELYKDSVTEKNLLGTQATGSDGKALFGEGAGKSNNLTYSGKAYYLKAGVKYVLVESKAPDGYQKDDEQKIFQLYDDKGSALLENIDAYNVGYTFEVQNSKHNFSIKKVSEHTAAALDGAEFTLYNDAGCKNEVFVSNGNSQGIHAFTGLMKGTYYLKETKVPGGYYDTKKVYEVVINDNGDAAINGVAVDADERIYTVANTLTGKISVTKAVKEDGVDSGDFGTYYTAIFSDSQFTKRVSDVKPIEMNGSQSETVTFEGLKLNDTYYVAETDETGKALPDKNDDGQWQITYDNQVVTLDFEHQTAKSRITNHFYSQYYWAGSIEVTKRVTLNGQDSETNNIFYAGIYLDEACKERVGDIKPLVMDGSATATTTFSDLTLNRTYYVAETDSEGNVVTDSQEQLNCNMSIDNKMITLSKEKTSGSAEIVNDYDEDEQFYYGGEITVNKKTTYNGEAYKSYEKFYAALFADEARTQRITDVKTLNMDGNSSAEVTFENLAYGTYYLAETNKNGEAMTDLEAADLGFTNVLDEEIQLDVDAVEVELENQMTEEFVVEHGGDPRAALSTAQTGDNSNITLMVLAMLAALTTAGIVLITRRRHNA